MDLSEIEKIIERDLPSQRMSKKSIISEHESRDFSDALETEKPEASTPEIQILREKYLREKFFGDADSTNLENPQKFPQTEANSPSENIASEAEDVIVAVRPKEVTNLSDDSSQLKAVVISATEKKIIGQQG